MADAGNLELLLSHAREDDGPNGEPVLAHGPSAAGAAGEATQVSEELDGSLANITANANSLPDQRWAVVAAHGPEGDRLCKWVERLVEKRAQDQDKPVVTIRVPPGMDTAQAERWKQREFSEQYGGKEDDRPRYLCILGDVDHVSLATQEVLALDGFPGRLVCRDEAGYQAYVDKVLRWEKRPSRTEQPRADRPRALFYTVDDGTNATRAGHEKLLHPCYAMARSEWDATAGDCAFRSTQPQLAGDSGGPDPDGFLDLVAQPEPTLLFSMSHGLGPPRRRRWTPEQARESQGAMVFGMEEPITPSDVAAADSFLPGGLWFYYACFGAGTPKKSAYHHWLDMLASAGVQGMSNLGGVLKGLDDHSGFTSGIAQAALAHPSGPLGVIGHIDLAWSYGYEHIQVEDGNKVTGEGRAHDYYTLLTKLVDGERLGVSILRLQMALHDMSSALNNCYDRFKEQGKAAEGDDDSDRMALAHMWMRRQDLLGYVMLGDPAVRLPLARFQPEPDRLDKGGVQGNLSGSGGATVNPEHVNELEKAALGRSSVASVARKLRMSRDDVTQHVEAYKQAGREELERRLGKGSDDE